MKVSTAEASPRAACMPSGTRATGMGSDGSVRLSICRPSEAEATTA